MDIPEILPKEWGPSAWKFIHYVALKYPKNPTEEDKKQYFIFFHNLQFILPCDKCAKHFKDNLLKNPIQSSLDNNKTLFKWTVDIHNMVNKDLNKKEVTYEEALKIYLNSNINSEYDMYIKIAGASALLLILYYLHKKYKIFSRFL